MSSLPDTVPNDPTEIAQAVALSFDVMPTVDEYVQNPESFDFSDNEDELENEEPAEKLLESVAETGFVINADEFDFDDDLAEDEEDI